VSDRARDRPSFWPRVFGDLAGPISSGSVAGVTQSWRSIQLTFTAAMQTNSVLRMIMGLGNTASGMQIQAGLCPATNQP
jgi:hypothetical protein